MKRTEGKKKKIDATQENEKDHKIVTAKTDEVEKTLRSEHIMKRTEGMKKRST